MELWKPIPGFDDRYEASTAGRIRVKPDAIDAVGRTRYAGKLRKPMPSYNGYDRVGLSDNGKLTIVSVHVAVALAFIGPRPRGHNINHKNGNKRDNRPDNLEYATQQENYQHAMHVLGFRPQRGAKHWARRRLGLSDSAVAEIKRRALAGETHESLAAEYGCSTTTISHYRNDRHAQMRKFKN